LGAPEEPPASARALPTLPEPNTVVLAIGGPLSHAAVERLCERVAALLEETEATRVVCDVEALLHPDAATLDALARLQLSARRLGRRVWIRNACGELQDLLALAGLRGVMPSAPASDLQPRRKAEQREQGLGVEEEAEPTDPVP
jgi:anti-anti-sigma factor